MSAPRPRETDRITPIFIEACLAGFRQKPPILDWARSLNVIVPTSANRMYGGKPYDFGAFPVMASLMFGFFEDASAREMHLMKDTQGSASTHSYWACAWTLAFDPGNVIYITKGRDTASNTWKDRMEHIFEGAPQLRRQKNDGIPNSTAMARRFNGGSLFLGGCDSATALIGQPASIIMLDEIKEHPFIDGKSTTELARMRIKADSTGKLLTFSTAGDAVEYIEKDGKKTPIATPESTPHLEYLTGTQEECHVPCPHCGFYQRLEFERLQFGHCRESLPGLPDQWNYQRVLAETWYRCANPDCTDKAPDGTTRGRITEAQKPDIIARHRWIPTNPNPIPGRRSASISVLYNIAFPTSSWGHVALAFIDATQKGTSEALKAFHTDWLGKPWTPHRITSQSMAKVIALKRGYRTATYDGEPLYRIPFTTAETAFVGATIDIQADHVKWLIHAATWDDRNAVLHYGMSQFVEDLPDILRARFYTCTDTADHPGLGFPVTVAYMDVNGTRRAELYRHLAAWRTTYPEILWEGIVGRDAGQTQQVRIAAWEPRQFPVLDEYRRPTFDPAGRPISIRVHHIDADHWETQLYHNTIDAYDLKTLRATYETQGHPPAEAEKLAKSQQKLLLPGDVPDSFIRELCNMRQVPKKTGFSGHLQYRWQKIHQGPNDYGDLIKYAKAQTHIVRQESAPPPAE